LTHFQEPVFPRTISTRKSKGRQFEIFNKEEMIRAYEESNFVDCRVNAYPSYTEYKGIQRYPPNFIFADLDLTSSKDRQALDRAVDATLRTLRFRINGSPTVLWTGNGYHIYQPIEAVIFEQFVRFEGFEQPSAKFLRFAEQYLTNEKSDPSHNPSFKSCMIRIPGSINSKCQKGSNEVKIIQKWDGYRPPISLLLSAFYDYLVGEKEKETKFQNRVKRAYGIQSGQISTLTWIETLLKTPIEDYRKNTIGLILSPYLVNIKKLSYSDAFQVIKNWLRKCNELRYLDTNFDYKIKYSLNAAIRKRQLPMKFETLKTKNIELYTLLRDGMQSSTESTSNKYKE
jgi:Primase X